MQPDGVYTDRNMLLLLVVAGFGCIGRGTAFVWPFGAAGRFVMVKSVITLLELAGRRDIAIFGCMEN